MNTHNNNLESTGKFTYLLIPRCQAILIKTCARFCGTPIVLSIFNEVNVLGEGKSRLGERERGAPCIPLAESQPDDELYY